MLYLSTDTQTNITSILMREKDIIMRSTISKLIRLLVLILVCYSLSSCEISINENEYRFLTKTEKSHFKPFANSIKFNTNQSSDSIFIYEITPNDVKEITQQHKFTFVHLWVPYCRGLACQNVLANLSAINNKVSQDDLSILLISNTYSYNDIKNALEKSKFALPIYVLSNSYLGEKTGKAKKIFAREIDNNKLVPKNKFFEDYFFKNTTLIKACWNLTAYQIDSIISENRK
jgi:hypothetical protein